MGIWFCGCCVWCCCLCLLFFGVVFSGCVGSCIVGIFFVKVSMGGVIWICLVSLFIVVCVCSIFCRGFFVIVVGFVWMRVVLRMLIGVFSVRRLCLRMRVGFWMLCFIIGFGVMCFCVVIVWFVSSSVVFSLSFVIIGMVFVGIDCFGMCGRR